MDTTNPQPVQVPQTAADPAPQVTPVQPNLSPSGGSKKILIIVLILVALTVVAGALIYLRNSRVFKASAPAKTVVNAFDDLKNELESIDVGASETDLSEFDKDLNSL